MSYNVNGNNMLQWFYPTTAPSIAPNNAPTTNFKINNVDISNNYVKLGTNSNIPVSQLYSINFLSGGQSIGNLFELNLPIFTGTLNVDYKIIPPSNHSGLLIQILNNNTLTFNYNVNCSFWMVGGGGGGGGSADSNAGGGGGGGELISGNIADYAAGIPLSIIIGNGGNGGNGTRGDTGGDTSITYSGNTLTAFGGGYGGGGKGSGESTTGSSGGGSGSYDKSVPSAGTSTPRTISNFSIFKNLVSSGKSGSLGNDQNNNTGAGGGGGGASSAGSYDVNNEKPGNGGNGITLMFGSITFFLAGGGGGGGRGTHDGQGEGSPIGGNGADGGGAGGGRDTQDNGYPGTENTGGGGGGASNDGGDGGNGGSGTVILYILPSGVSI